MFGRVAIAALGIVAIYTVIMRPLMEKVNFRGTHKYGETTSLSLHYNAFVSDPRPRIKIFFEGFEPKIGFSLIFDTGSESSHILLHTDAALFEQTAPSYLAFANEPVNRSAWSNEGLRKLDSSHGNGPVLCYGSPDFCRRIPTYGKSDMNGVIFSGENAFSFGIDVFLTKKIDTDYTGIGLLGAGPTSRFALSAGIFAFLGVEFDQTDLPNRNAGSLFIGERDISTLNRNCLKGHELKFHSMHSDLSRFDWVVGGSVSMKNRDGTETSRNDINWVVDTGAVGIYVTSEMRENLKKAMLDNGAELASDDRWLIYRKCPNVDVLPSLIYHLGTGADAVPVVINPADYLDFFPNSCILKVYSNSSFTKDSKLLGIPVLSKLLTVFDADYARMGFCNSRL
jgi:hypothetical protein